MKPPATLSIDLDNKWSYLQTRGDSRWQSLPGFLPLVIDRVLAFTERHNQKLTAFVVGRDAEQPVNAAPLRGLVRAGHEIGNHSFHHEAWRIHLPEGNAEREISETAAAIQAACGVTPKGYRSPGFRLSPQIIDLLRQQGYTYDASTCPNLAGPLAGVYYDLANRNKPERHSGAVLYGGISEAFRSLRAHRWPNGLLELPVSTVPIVRLPVHASYLFYLATLSAGAARAWFWTFLSLCRLTGTAPSFLLHSTDFLGAEDDADMHFFPGMRLPLRVKLRLLERWMWAMQRHFEVTTLEAYARMIEC